MEVGVATRWLLALLVLGAMTVPLSTWLFQDRSAGAFALPVGAAVLAVVGHLVGQVAFGLPAAVAGVAVLGIGSGLVWQRVTPLWRAYAEPAVVFVGGFALVVAIRSVEPSAAPLPLAVGEKMLDFGLLATLDRSGTLPPEDMWFAGETVLYHYGGHATTSLLSSLTGTPPRFAYNLGLATFYGLLVSAAYGLAGAIADPYGVPRRYAAGLGAVFVALASNLHTPAQLVGWLLPDGLARFVVGLAGLDPAVATWSPADIGEFWYFRASRVMFVDPSVPADDTFLAATEFPLFAWLNGDLHAHMMSQPFLLLAAGLLLTYWRLPPVSRRRPLLLLGAVPPVAGLIGFVNLWSFPTVGGLVVIVVAFAPGEPLAPLFKEAEGRAWEGWREDLSWQEHWALEELRRFGIGVLAAAVVLALALLWTLPYWLEVVVRGPSQTVRFWGKWSPLGSLLIVHGAFLVAVVAYLSARGLARLESPAVVGGIGLLGLVAGVAVGAPALGLFVPVGLFVWWLLRAGMDADFELALALAGIGLVLLVELVTVEGERFNVIFKYYAHVWLFFAITAAVVLTRLASGLPSLSGSLDRVRWALAARALVAVLVVTTGIYAGIALSVHFSTGSTVTEAQGTTLDATAYLETEYPAEAAAIRWLDERDGQPTIVTAAPGQYRWRPSEGEGASAPASLTGQPTVLGWFHERQYRGEDPYRERLAAVETIYTGSPDARGPLLERYDVAYIYVGPAERNHYDEQIELGDDPDLTVAREFADVTIYAYEGS